MLQACSDHHRSINGSNKLNLVLFQNPHHLLRRFTTTSGSVFRTYIIWVLIILELPIPPHPAHNAWTTRPHNTGKSRCTWIGEHPWCIVCPFDLSTRDVTNLTFRLVDRFIGYVLMVDPLYESHVERSNRWLLQMTGYGFTFFRCVKRALNMHICSYRADNGYVVQKPMSIGQFSLLNN